MCLLGLATPVGLRDHSESSHSLQGSLKTAPSPWPRASGLLSLCKVMGLQSPDPRAMSRLPSQPVALSSTDAAPLPPAPCPSLWTTSGPAR